MKIILIMGLPGSGKTTLASELAPLINAKRINADEVRKAANDWDFSEEGRTRQAKRMADLAKKIKERRRLCCCRFYLSNTKSKKFISSRLYHLGRYH